jgi:hypothetical protein
MIAPSSGSGCPNSDSWPGNWLLSLSVVPLNLELIDPYQVCALGDGDIMRKISDYEQHADECRAMAATSQNPTHKQQLEEMAEAWARLARVRRRQLLKLAVENLTVASPPVVG